MSTHTLTDRFERIESEITDLIADVERLVDCPPDPGFADLAERIVEVLLDPDALVEAIVENFTPDTTLRETAHRAVTQAADSAAVRYELEEAWEAVDLNDARDSIGQLHGALERAASFVRELLDATVAEDVTITLRRRADGWEVAHIEGHEVGEAETQEQPTEFPVGTRVRTPAGEGHVVADPEGAFTGYVPVLIDGNEGAGGWLPVNVTRL